MGGRGASSGANKGGSSLAAFKENARQFTEAKIKALKEGATRLEYTDITGKIVTFYREGSAWRNRPNSMEVGLRERNGIAEKTYKSKFSGWDYREATERARQLEDGLEKRRSTRSINNLALSARQSIRAIDKELEHPDGNVARLKAAKYRLKKVVDKAGKKAF